MDMQGNGSRASAGRCHALTMDAPAAALYDAHLDFDIVCGGAVALDLGRVGHLRDCARGGAPDFHAVAVDAGKARRSEKAKERIVVHAGTPKYSSGRLSLFDDSKPPGAPGCARMAAEGQPEKR